MEQLVGRAVLFFSAIKFLAEIPKCFNFFKNKTTGSTSAEPFISGALCGAMWFQYGLLVSDDILIFTGLIAVMSHCAYCFFYFLYTPQKLYAVKQFGLAFILPASSFTYMIYFATTLLGAIRVSGTLACITNLLAFTPPVIALRDAIVRQDGQSLPFYSLLASFATNTIWFIYSRIHYNVAIMIPKIAGSFLSAMQLGVFFYYRKSLATVPEKVSDASFSKNSAIVTNLSNSWGG